MRMRSRILIHIPFSPGPSTRGVVGSGGWCAAGAGMGRAVASSMATPTIATEGFGRIAGGRRSRRTNRRCLQSNSKQCASGEGIEKYGVGILIARSVHRRLGSLLRTRSRPDRRTTPPASGHSPSSMRTDGGEKYKRLPEEQCRADTKLPMRSTSVVRRGFHPSGKPDHVCSDMLGILDSAEADFVRGR